MKKIKFLSLSFSRLFSPNMEVIKLNARSRDIAESTLNLYLDQCKNSTLLRSQRALVVDGKTLIYILDKRANIQHLFLDLTKMCSSVLACRATPLQVKNMHKIKICTCSCCVYWLYLMFLSCLYLLIAHLLVSVAWQVCW